MLLMALLAAEPPLGIPTAFWPSVALAFGVGVLFVKEVIWSGARGRKAEERAEKAEAALQELTVAVGQFLVKEAAGVGRRAR